MSRKNQVLIKKTTGSEEESEYTSGRLNNAKGPGVLLTDPFIIFSFRYPSPETRYPSR